jgi:23S rRNA (guanosine2251-2'-O)-methyltransferase
MKRTADRKADRRHGQRNDPRARRHAERDDRQPSAAPRETSEGTVRIWGNHAVEAALANEHRIVRRLHLTENAERRLASAITARSPVVVRCSPRDLDRLAGPESVHQGVVADVEPLPESDLSDLIATAEATGLPIVVLDQVTDPHNVGAILRSAAAMGTAGIVMTRRHSPPMAGVLAKAASGALELVPVALVGNLAQALGALGEAGVARLGLDGDGDHLIDDEPMAAPFAFVFGAEGKGLRRLSRELCDRLCRIGTTGGLASLNVSNAAAIALYAASQRRKSR